MMVLSFISVVLNGVALLILLGKIWITKSCFGISGKTQILFVIIYTSRYFELILKFGDYLDSDDLIFRLLFIFSCTTCYYIYRGYQNTYDRHHDSFRIKYLLIFVGFMALVLNIDTRILSYLNIFSAYLECVAILPQLFMIFKAGRIEISILCYLIVLALSCGFSTAFYWTNSPPWTYYHGWAFIIADMIYCGFFLYMIRGNIEISIKDTHLEKNIESNNNLNSREEYTGNTQFQANLKDCVLTLDAGDLKKHENNMSANIIEGTKGSITEAKSTLSPFGVYVMDNIDDSTKKPS